MASGAGIPGLQGRGAEDEGGPKSSHGQSEWGAGKGELCAGSVVAGVSAEPCRQPLSPLDDPAPPSSSVLPPLGNFRIP